MSAPLPPLPLAEWEPTKTTLHLWAQIVGKVRLALAPPRNHWWHVPLYVDVRGLTTRTLRNDGRTFRIDLDLVGHRLHVRTAEGEDVSFPLSDGLSVAAFDHELHALLRSVDLDVRIREEPYGVATTTPFPADREHAAYDRDAVARFSRILDWTDGVLEEFAGWFCGKTSPVQLFWHSFDLALSRYSGAPCAPRTGADPVEAEAYSHEVIAFGFWAGDERVREPAFYSYTAPEPAGLREQPLVPEAATWAAQGEGVLALVPYDAVRAAADPRSTLLAFFESAYVAGATTAGWDAEGLKSSWHPDRLGTGAIS